MLTKWALPPSPSTLLLALIISCCCWISIEFIQIGFLQLWEIHSNFLRVGCGWRVLAFGWLGSWDLQGLGLSFGERGRFIGARFWGLRWARRNRWCSLLVASVGEADLLHFRRGRPSCWSIFFLLMLLVHLVHLNFLGVQTSMCTWSILVHLVPSCASCAFLPHLPVRSCSRNINQQNLIPTCSIHVRISLFDPFLCTRRPVRCCCYLMLLDKWCWPCLMLLVDLHLVDASCATCAS